MMPTKTLATFAVSPLVARGQDVFLAKKEAEPASSASLTGRGLFESNCESDDDFGWPRFHNLVELQASPWAVYFNDTYGALPSSADDYPICTFDFWHLQPGTDVAALGLTPDSKKAMGVPEGPQLPRAITNILSQRHPQTAYHYRKGEYVNGDLFQGGIDMGYMIYHDWYFYHQLPSNTWTEVVHTAAFQLETEAMWFQRARGSGIWFNVGKTIAFDSHTDAFDHLFNGTAECIKPTPPFSLDPLKMAAPLENGVSKCARSRGYDSIQFRPGTPFPVLNTFGQAAWTELLSTRHAGKFACGTEQGGTSAGFRSGWRASQPCDCDPAQLLTKCRL